MDIAQRPPAVSELRRFIDRLGPEALLETESRAYRDGGLRYLRMDRAEMTERLLENPQLLRLPLVRAGNDFSAGMDDAAWKRMAVAQTPPP